MFFFLYRNIERDIISLYAIDSGWNYQFCYDYIIIEQ